MTQGQQVESNPVDAGSAAVPGQAGPDVSGTPENQSGQATTQVQSAPTEESFSSIDPTTLPPELQSIYKSLQADYTKKTQGVADTRKKADAYDQISRDQRFVDYWQGLNRTQKAEFKEQKAEVEKRLGEKITDDEFQKAFTDKDAYLSLHEKMIRDVLEKSQQKIQELEQKLSVKDAQDIVSSFATEIGKDGKPVRPDFDSLDEDRLITGYLNVNPPESQSEQAYVNRLNEAYGWAKAISQKYYDKGRSEALQIIQKKAATSTEPPTSGAKGIYSGPDPKKLTVREAMELAKKGQRVPRDD
jgi:hypothetical protein